LKSGEFNRDREVVSSRWNQKPSREFGFLGANGPASSEGTHLGRGKSRKDRVEKNVGGRRSRRDYVGNVRVGEM